MAYAYTTIEDPETGERYERGDSLPKGLPGLKELIEAGAAGRAKPTEEITASDSAGTSEESA